MRIDDVPHPPSTIDPQSGKALQACSTNALRALAQLPTRGTVTMSRVEPGDARMDGLESRPWKALRNGT